jgi:hypothetical protein
MAQKQVAKKKTATKKGTRKKADLEVAVAEVVDYMRITGQFAPALRDVVIRKTTAEAAKAAGVKITTKQLQNAADAFRIVHGLNKAKDAENWLKANGISLEALEDYLETNLLISNFKDRLAKKGGTKKYLASAQVKNAVRDMIYQGWLDKTLK